MIPAFSIALSALTADSTAIDITGNNLANLNTTGFKASDVGFHDLISQSLGVGSTNGQVGMGVGQVSAVQNFSQGSINNTGGSTDAAIEGNGFFVVKDQNNNQLYTRAGNFTLDSSGNLVTATGENVQGWSAVNGVLNANGAIGNINVPLGAVLTATATTNISASINLNAAATAGGATGAFSAPIQVYDAEGTAHTLTINFTKVDANNWDYEVDIPAADLIDGGTTNLATGTLTFDGTGQLTSPAAGAPVALAIAGFADGADDLAVNWNLYNGAQGAITQLAQASGISSPTQDGHAAGQITKVGMQDGGLVVANFSNGQQITIGQLALASITNPDSLMQVGNNNLAATALTAQPAIGTANSGGRGQIVGGSLESSTTDMAREFTNLLTFERSYQAASRVITTSDQILQDTVNLVRG